MNRGALLLKAHSSVGWLLYVARHAKSLFSCTLANIVSGKTFVLKEMGVEVFVRGKGVLARCAFFTVLSMLNNMSFRMHDQAFLHQLFLFRVKWCRVVASY